MWSAGTSTSRRWGRARGGSTDPCVLRRIGQLRELGEHAVELPGECCRPEPCERCRELAVVPQAALATAGETAPDLLADASVVGEHAAQVVQLVGRRDEPGLWRGLLEVGEVGELALLPRPLLARGRGV